MGKDYPLPNLPYVTIGSLFCQRPARRDPKLLHCPRGAVGLPTEGRECYARLFAKKLTDSKKLLYKYLFAIYDVDTTLHGLLYATTAEIVDSLCALVLNALDTGCTIGLTCNYNAD